MNKGLTMTQFNRKQFLIEHLIEDDMNKIDTDTGQQWIKELLRSGWGGYKEISIKDLEKEWDERCK